ncbi:MAG: SpoVG family protein [Oscillospiraceae bacterium]|jgi:stage V sporulation protein G|nr:SpoVG family protein [Oscillospiraceae bacterium]
MVDIADITVEARAYPLKEKHKNTLAYASVNIGGIVAINSVRISDSRKGIFVAMPQQKTKNGEYKPYCFPLTAELRDKINATVLAAYDLALQEKEEPTKESAKAKIKEARENPAPKKEKGAAVKTEPAR